MQTNKPDELVGFLGFGSPKSLATFGDQGLATVSHSVAFNAFKGSREKFHDFLVGVQRRKWFAVSCEPLAQTEAFGFKLN